MTKCIEEAISIGASSAHQMFLRAFGAHGKILSILLLKRTRLRHLFHWISVCRMRFFISLRIDVAPQMCVEISNLNVW